MNKRVKELMVCGGIIVALGVGAYIYGNPSDPNITSPKTQLAQEIETTLEVNPIRQIVNQYQEQERLRRVEEETQRVARIMALPPHSLERKELESNINVYYDANDSNTYYDIPLSKGLQDHAESLCKEYNVNKRMVYAIMKKENETFNPSLKHINTNGTIDYGIMQINTCNVKSLSKKLGVTNILDPHQNLRVGVYILSRLNGGYENIHDVADSYNKGVRGHKKLVKKGYHTTRYSREIVSNLYDLKVLN